MELEAGLPPGNDKIRGTLSTAEIFIPQKKNLTLYFLIRVIFAEEWQPCTGW